MRWQTKPQQRAADRTRIIFAFLPHAAENGKTYWLEDIIVREAYSEKYGRWIKNRFYPITLAGIRSSGIFSEGSTYDG
jgi:hypothetical protein